MILYHGTTMVIPDHYHQKVKKDTVKSFDNLHLVKYRLVGGEQ